jgi:hypothetical protein
VNGDDVAAIAAAAMPRAFPALHSRFGKAQQAL